VPSGRRSKWNRPARELSAGAAAERADSWQGVEYRVRSVAGSGSSGSYRCPGCDLVLAPGTPHLVAWPADDPAADYRRHWHTGCWAARERRSPGIQRSRNAPRYG